MDDAAEASRNVRKQRVKSEEPSTSIEPPCTAKADFEPRRLGARDSGKKPKPPPSEPPPGAPGPLVTVEELKALSDENIVSRRVSVYWELDEAWYNGLIVGTKGRKGQVRILYDDGESEQLTVGSDAQMAWLPDTAPDSAEKRPRRRR